MASRVVLVLDDIGPERTIPAFEVAAERRLPSATVEAMAVEADAATVGVEASVEVGDTPATVGTGRDAERGP